MNKSIQKNSIFQTLCRVLSFIAVSVLFSVVSMEQGRASADTTSGRALVLLYADPENDSGLIFQGTEHGQSGQGNDDSES